MMPAALRTVRIAPFGIGTLTLTVLAACAADSSRSLPPVALEHCAPDGTVLRCTRVLEVPLQGDADLSPIHAGSNWHRIGTIPQGMVYASEDSILMANFGDLHEALLVVSEGAIVGVYLAVEHGFVPAESPVKVAGVFAELRTVPAGDHPPGKESR